MIQFVAATGTPEAVARAAPDLPAALEATQLLRGELVERRSPTDRWAFAAFVVPDELVDDRVAGDGERLLAFNGSAWAVEGGQRDLARRLLERVTAEGSVGAVGQLSGSYNLLSFTPEHGLLAFPDFSGLYPLYYGSGSGLAVVSNRPSTAARVIGSSDLDQRALAWIIGHASLFDDALPNVGVRHVLPGTELVAELGSPDLHSRRGPGWIWPDDVDDGGRDNLTDDEWDAVTSSLVANYRAVAELSDDLVVSLTGGKDSRMALAVAKAAGLGDRIRTRTSGPEGSPEVEVAVRVAEAAGVFHERAEAPTASPSTPAPPSPPEIDVPALWRRMRRNSYRYDNVVSAWSGLTNPIRGKLTVKGFGGEFYRRGNTRQRTAAPRTVDELAESFTNFQQVHDPLKVLRSAVADEQSDWMRRWVHTNAKDFRFDLLAEKFYVDYRLSHWTGVLMQSTPNRINVNPLLSLLAVQKNMELSAVQRSAERFHFEVTRRAAPELVAIPFLNDVWAAEIRRTSPVELPSEPYPVTKMKGRKSGFGNPGWAFLEQGADSIDELFQRARTETQMHQICDLGKLRKQVRKPRRLIKVPHIRELFSAIGAAIALLGEGTQTIDDPNPGAV